MSSNSYKYIISHTSCLTLPYRDQEERQMKDIFSEVISTQLRSDGQLDTTKPFSDVVQQAAALLGNNESLVRI